MPGSRGSSSRRSRTGCARPTHADLEPRRRQLPAVSDEVVPSAGRIAGQRNRLRSRHGPLDHAAEDDAARAAGATDNLAGRLTEGGGRVDATLARDDEVEPRGVEAELVEHE